MKNNNVNPLLAASSNLIAAIIELSHLNDLGDASVLHQNLIKELSAFEVKAKALKVSTNNLNAAHYILCSSIDELVLNKIPNNTISLQHHFYNDNANKEKIVSLLEKLKQAPNSNIDLLELINLCLCLGFQGKYSSLKNGEELFAEIKDQLLADAQQQQGSESVNIFPPYHYKSSLKKRRKPWLPIVCAAVITLLIMGSMLFIFNKNLTKLAKPIYQSLTQVN